MLRLSILVAALLGSVAHVRASSYHEELVLQPLPQSALLASFSFASNTPISDYENQNYNLFPRSLGQILLHSHVEELHLRFALGRWDTANWGSRPRGGRREGGTGVELWAWLEANGTAEANARWFSLTNALSGLFCASLNFVDQTKTIRPVSSFDREGNRPSRSLHHLHGALPHEVVCTENLTPFLKLLPCKGKAGISTLLDGHKLFDASWQTMSITVRKTCSDAACDVQIEQTVDMVVDIERSTRPSSDPIPRPAPIESIDCDTSKHYNGHDTCFPRRRDTERAWDIQSVFGRTISGSCPIGQSHEGEVHLLVPSTRIAIAQSGEAFLEPTCESSTSRRFRLPESGTLNIAVSEYPIDPPAQLDPPVLRAERTFTGYGQQRGGVHSVLVNTSPSPIELVYLESLPWFMKPYLHTLTTTLIHNHDPAATYPTTSPVLDTLYRPALDRSRPTHLELRLHVPAHSALVLNYDFEKAILRYTEYPPDANRGFDVAPAIIRILPQSLTTTGLNASIPLDPTLAALEENLGTAQGAQSTYVRTTSLLLPLPTPDFSMPYNVIILTSTVIAMGFGGVFNILTRRFVGADEVGPRPALKGLVLGKIAAGVGKVRDMIAARGKGVVVAAGSGGEPEANGNANGNAETRELSKKT